MTKSNLVLKVQGKVCWQKCQQHRNTISASLHASATLGGSHRHYI
jgi:hypothetical protein